MITPKDPLVIRRERIDKVYKIDESVFKDAMEKFFKSLEYLHPFADGNCRTFFTLLLSRELINNGFSPAIFNDPNMFDGLSIEESIHHIVIPGMKNFHDVKNGKLPDGMKTTEEILKKWYLSYWRNYRQ